jgi:hypothetical protein
MAVLICCPQANPSHSQRGGQPILDNFGVLFGGSPISTHCLSIDGVRLHQPRTTANPQLALVCSWKSTSDLDFLLSRSTPNWHEVVNAAAKGGHLHVFW